MPERLRFSGGIGGVEANLDDLRRYADIAHRIGDALADASGVLARLAASPAVAMTAPLSPLTATRSQGQALAASAHLQLSRAELQLNALRLQVTADLTEGVDRLQDVVGSTWSRFQLVAAFTYEVARTGQALRTSLLRGSAEAIEVLWTEGWGAFGIAVRDIPRNAVSQSIDTQRWLDLVTDHPVVTDVVVDVVVIGVSALTQRPQSYEDAVRLVTDVGALFGFIQDSSLTTSRTDLNDLSGDALTWTRVPTNLEELLSNQRAVQDAALADENSSRIRITEVPGEPTSSWIVQVPGTQTLAVAGSNPADMATNLHLSGGQRAALLDAIDDALRDAGVGTDPVLIAGHSQGGIAAAAFSEQAVGRGYNVTHVVTAGSPIAHVAVPSNVQVLAIEHDNDPVARVDTGANPGTVNITTVTAAVGGSSTYENPIGPHAGKQYQHTAQLIDASDDPSVQHFLQSSEHFFSGPTLDGQAAVDSGLITDYRVHREQP